MATYLDLGTPVTVGRRLVSTLAAPERRRLDRYVKLTDVGQDRVSLSSRSRYAGRLRLGALDLWLPPDCGTPAFVQLALLHSGVSPEALRTVDSVAASPFLGGQGLTLALAHVLAIQADEVLRHHVSQSYVRKTEHLPAVRGRIKWSDPTALIPPGSVLCTHMEKSTDNLPNRLIVAGLEAAERLTQASPELAALVVRQKARWLSVAASSTPTWRQFDVALEKLDRQTSHYRDALLASRALLFGLNIEDREQTLLTGVLDLAAAFETLVSRLLKLALQESSTRFRAQSKDPGAFVFKNDLPYMKPRPDFVLSLDGQPVTIVDAKYKAYYCRFGPGSTRANRISAEDLYQMALYGLRRLQLSNEKARVFIVAPQLRDDTAPDLDNRVVNLRLADATSMTIELVPIPLAEAISVAVNDDIDRARTLLRPVLDVASARSFA